MMPSSTNRLLTVLVALLFGLGWGAPVGHASCGPMGPSSPNECHESGSERHCEGDVGPSSVCLSHHASQEALTGESLLLEEASSPESQTPDLQGESSATVEKRPVDSSLQQIGSTLSFVWCTAPPAHRLHVVIGVWLE